MRLDIRDDFPSGMSEYLSCNGWHFNRSMCEFAVHNMTKENKQRIQPYSQSEVNDILVRNGISVNNLIGYDAVFVANMAKADYLGSSVIDEHRLARFIKDYLDDPDGYDTIAFTRFYADCIGKGVIIPWKDVL